MKDRLQREEYDEHGYDAYGRRRFEYHDFGISEIAHVVAMNFASRKVIEGGWTDAPVNRDKLHDAFYRFYMIKFDIILGQPPTAKEEDER